MQKQIILSIISLLAVSLAAVAAPTFNSTYPLGTDSDKAMEFCTEVPGQEFGTLFSCPMMPELTAQGYTMEEFLHDHGVVTVLNYKGNQLNLGLGNTMVYGEVWEYNLPEGYSPSWADWGTANSVYEYRFTKENGKRTPFAMIYRRNFVSWAMSDSGFDVETIADSTSSALLIVKFDGLNTSLYAAVDSVAAWKAGDNANELARLCADSIMGQGDPKACDAYPVSQKQN